MNIIFSALCLSIATLLTACGSFRISSAQPAIISNPSAEVKAELTEKISLALNGTQILLANDAFTTSSQLTLTRKQHQTLQHGITMGRSVEHSAMIFELVKHNNHCYVVHAAKQTRFKLEKSKCQSVTHNTNNSSNN